MFDWNNDAQREAFLDYLEIADEPDERNAMDMAFYYARLAGLDELHACEVEMRKHDLAQIGMVLLSLVAEANHSSWDGMEREEVEAWNSVLKDIRMALQDEDYMKYNEDPAWGFGGDEWWDHEGKRHLHSEEEPT